MKSQPRILFSWLDGIIGIDDGASVLSHNGIVVDALPTFEQGFELTASVDSSENGRMVSSTWETITCKGHVIAQEVAEGITEFSCKLEMKQKMTLGNTWWNVLWDLTNPRSLNSRYQLCRLSRAVWVNSWTPFALMGESTGKHIQVSCVEQPMVSKLQPHRRKKVQWCAFLDHEMAHPRFHVKHSLERDWDSRYTYPAGQRLAISFRVIVNQSPRPLVVVGRFPENYRAAMTITDHADHDSCEKFKALLFGKSEPDGKTNALGFASLSLPFTKSVFTSTTEPDGPGLQNPEFAELCEAASHAGIEICPHGIHQWVQPPADDVWALLRPFERFHPRTWIDHGFSFRTTYSKDGWNPNSDFYLLPHLDKLGIKYIWGFIDFGQSIPRGRLDQLDGSHYSGLNYILDQFSLVTRVLRKRKPWVILHGISSVLYQLLPSEGLHLYYLLQMAIHRVMRKRAYGEIPTVLSIAVKLAFSLLHPISIAFMVRTLLGPRLDTSLLSPVLFAEHNSVTAGTCDKWLFNTVAVHDVEDAFNSKRLAQLIEDYGLHVAHTYLGSVSPAHISHPVRESTNGGWELTPEFVVNLRNIASLRDDGRLWFATMSDIGDFMRFQKRIRVIPEQGCWRLVCPETDKQMSRFQVFVIGKSGPITIDGRPTETTQLDAQRRMIRLDLHPGERELQIGM